jgi:hypothetical protein
MGARLVVTANERVTMVQPVKPTVPADSTKPEDIKAWEDYYADCENWADQQKPCMDRDW